MATDAGPFRLLHSLPVELVIQIVLRLPAEDVVRLGLADRRLREVACDPQVWLRVLAAKGLGWLSVDGAAALLRRVGDAVPQLAALRGPDAVATALKVLYFWPRSVGRDAPSELDSVCRHISFIREREVSEYASVFASVVLDTPLASDAACMGPPGPPLPDDEGNVDPADANGTPCSYSLPDLWLCLAPGCGSVRCGRTCRLHALGHYHREKGPHCAVIKLSTAEVWCYQCERWLGTVQSHPLEFLRIREVGARMLGVDRPGVVGNLQGPALGNGGAVGRAIRWSAAHREYLLNPRRQEERSWSMRGDQGDGPVWLIGQPFLSQWNAFLIGNGPPPESADHASLYIPGTSPPRINPELAFLGVSFVSAHDRARFAAAYPSTGLGPVCETAIPDTEEYTVLRRFVARHRLANAEWQGDDMEGEGEWEGDDFDDEAEVMEAFQQFMGI